jgi:hypothetical protein
VRAHARELTSGPAEGSERPTPVGPGAVSAYRRSGLELVSGAPRHLLQRQSVAVGVGQLCVLDSSATSSTALTSTPRPTSSVRACSMSATTRCKPFMVPGAISGRWGRAGQGSDGSERAAEVPGLA